MGVHSSSERRREERERMEEYVESGVWSKKGVGVKKRSTEPVFVKFMGLRNRFRGIDSASLCSLAGRYD